MVAEIDSWGWKEVKSPIMVLKEGGEDVSRLQGEKKKMMKKKQQLSLLAVLQHSLYWNHLGWGCRGAEIPLSKTTHSQVVRSG